MEALLDAEAPVIEIKKRGPVRWTVLAGDQLIASGVVDAIVIGDELWPTTKESERRPVLSHGIATEMVYEWESESFPTIRGTSASVPVSGEQFAPFDTVTIHWPDCLCRL